MLTLSQYGVTLKRLSVEDIEEVRCWRNKQFIKDKMLYSEEITPEMQQDWYVSINNKYNYYFIIIDGDGGRVGLINSKNINLENKSGEGGIFISDRKNWNTLTPVLASMIVLNFSIVLLQSFKKSTATVLKSNHSAIDYNKRLGYYEVEKNEEVIKMELTKESYIEATYLYSQTLKKVFPTEYKLVYSGSESENNIQEINNLLSN